MPSRHETARYTYWEPKAAWSGRLKNRTDMQRACIHSHSIEKGSRMTASMSVNCLNGSKQRPGVQEEKMIRGATRKCRTYAGTRRALKTTPTGNVRTCPKDSKTRNTPEIEIPKCPRRCHVNTLVIPHYVFSAVTDLIVGLDKIA